MVALSLELGGLKDRRWIVTTPSAQQEAPPLKWERAAPDRYEVLGKQRAGSLSAKTHVKGESGVVVPTCMYLKVRIRVPRLCVLVERDCLP